MREVISVQFLIDQSKKVYESIQLLNEAYSPTEEFTIQNIVFGRKSMKKIDMNPFSISLITKSFLYTNSGAIFLNSLINLFQKLKISTEENPICYNSCSHSLTTFYLRVLAKKGIIEIERCTHVADQDLECYYEALGNFTQKTELKMYDVEFVKKRSLAEEDFEVIREIERFLHIPNDYLIIEVKNGSLTSRLNTSRIIGGLLRLHPIRQTLGRIHNQFKLNGDEPKTLKNNSLKSTKQK